MPFQGCSPNKFALVQRLTRAPAVPRAPPFARRHMRAPRRYLLAPGKDRLRGCAGCHAFAAWTCSIRADLPLAAKACLRTDMLRHLAHRTTGGMLSWPRTPPWMEYTHNGGPESMAPATCWLSEMRGAGRVPWHGTLNARRAKERDAFARGTVFPVLIAQVTRDKYLPSALAPLR